ncbi:MAG: hypothetical protein KGM24_12275 [Elusimicrobia bacterium]|nr:hypothetical protein [Elusimicrobiota bacterium]
MTTGPEYDLEKLAKELVVGRLKGDADAPVRAAELARRTAVAAVASTRARQDPRLTIVAVCRGAMGGILLLDQSLPAAAVALLSQMATLAQEANLDPADCMTWAMQGIAPVCRLAPAGAADAVQSAIDENFMGAGAVFGEILQAAGR